MPQPPNKIKYYSGQTVNNSIKNKNFILGINNAGNYGPTSSTGFWNGISPPTNGYTIYGNKPVGGPAIFVANNDTQLINFAKSMSGTNITGATQSLTYYHTSNLLCVNRDYEDIVTSGLTVLLDAGFTLSYPRSGTTWSDLSFSGNNGTLFNGPVYSGTGGGSIVFDGVDDYCDISATQMTSSLITITGFIKWLAGTGGMFFGFTNYDVWTQSGNLGYNRAASDIYGISSATVTSLGLIGNWIHYTFIMTNTGSIPTNNKLYINGNLQTLSQQLGTTGNASGFGSTLRLASWPNGGFYGNMQYGNLQVYNRELNQTEITQNYNAQKSRYIPTPTPTPIPPTPTPIPPTPTPTSSTDSDAQAFITAAGITDPTQQSAINTLVVGLKTDGLWASMIAIYPFVGGTASSHKYNLKDPRDLNAAYRLTFYGGWVHNSSGIVGNFTNTYTDTYIVNYNLGQIGAYTTAGDYSLYGGRYAVDYQYDTLYYFPNISYFAESAYQVAYFSNTTDGSNIMFTFSGYIGLSTISGGDGTSKQYFNGSLIANITPSANPSPLPVSLWFGAVQTGYNLNNPTYDFYSNGTYAFGFVSSATFNSTQNTNLYNRIQTYQITLGRDV